MTADGQTLKRVHPLKFIVEMIISSAIMLEHGRKCHRRKKKALTLLYTDSIVKAYKIFSSDESFEGITNVYDLNQHPNETMVVDDALYHAFELIAETENRAIYLAPVYTEYDNLFFL